MVVWIYVKWRSQMPPYCRLCDVTQPKFNMEKSKFWRFFKNNFTSSRCSLYNFKSTGISVQEKKRKTDFQDGDCGGHIGFSIRTILFYYIQVTQILPTKFQVDWLFGSEQNRCSRWRPSWIFLTGMSLAIFDLRGTLILLTKFRVNWPRRSWLSNQIVDAARRMTTDDGY